MPDAIRIEASMRMRCTPAQAREQYRDIDHHIRNNVHPGIQYRWEPAGPGERKIRTEFRILGVPQYDVSLLEDAPDGSFLIRYLEGTNAGMLLVHEFVEVEPGVTEVRLSADAPATWGRRLLGPLFVIGARQVMKKALAEDKRDLEGGKYQPGVAAGDVERAFDVTALTAVDAGNKRLLLDAACLMAGCDGVLEAPERDAILRLAAALGHRLTADELDRRLTAVLELEKTPQFAAQIERTGSELAGARLGLAGVRAAAVIGLVSEGLSSGELAVLTRLAKSADVGEAELGQLISEVDEALGR
jgi:hypothetical protein